MQKKLGQFLYEEKKTDFRLFSFLFTAGVWPRPPGPPLVPGVFFLQFCYQLEMFMQWTRPIANIGMHAELV